MGLFRNIISSGGQYINNDPNFQLQRGFAEDSWMYGSFRALARPSMIYYNGSTYSLWYKEKANLNQVGIFKQNYDDFESALVNSGTVSEEPINHPAPMLHINKTTGYIYVLQNRLHIDEIRVWKSTNPEDISSFDYVGAFGDKTSYLGHLKGDESDIVIVTRAGDGVTDFYGLSVISVNLDTLIYTQTQVTDADLSSSNQRHYPLFPFQYGTSANTYLAIAHRNQIVIGNQVLGYYKYSLLVTNDFQTFRNIDNSFSKDVNLSPLTNAELDANFLAVGQSDSLRTELISEGRMNVLNDDVYFVFMSDENSGIYSIRKYSNGSSSYTDFVIPVTNIVVSPIYYSPIYMRHNGSNWVFTIYRTAGDGSLRCQLFISETDFTGFKRVNVDLKSDSTSPPPASGFFYGMPSNLHEAVDSNNKYLMIGKDEGSSDGQFNYCITRNKWMM